LAWAAWVLQLGLDGRALRFQAGHGGRIDLGQLDHRDAEVAVDRRADLAGRQGEHGVGHLAVGQGGLRLGVDHHRLLAVGAGDDGRLVALGQALGDRRGGLGVGGDDLDERAGLGRAQGVLAEVVGLDDVGLGHGHRAFQGLGAEAGHRQDPRLGTGQLGGVLLHEGLELGVGRGGRLFDGRGIDREGGQVAAFQAVGGLQGRIDARGAQAGGHGAEQMGLGDVVAQRGFVAGRGQLVLGQQALVHLGVELAGDRIERALAGGRLASCSRRVSPTSLSDGRTPILRISSARDSCSASWVSILRSTPCSTAMSGVMIWPWACSRLR
jgi:hypothetical protein